MQCKMDHAALSSSRQRRIRWFWNHLPNVLSGIRNDGQVGVAVMGMVGGRWRRSCFQSTWAAFVWREVLCTLCRQERPKGPAERAVPSVAVQRRDYWEAQRNCRVLGPCPCILDDPIQGMGDGQNLTHPQDHHSILAVDLFPRLFCRDSPCCTTYLSAHLAWLTKVTERELSETRPEM